MPRLPRSRPKRASQGRPKHPASRIIGTAIAAVLVPVVGLILLEAGLRAGGYGANTNLVLELADDPTHTCYLNADVARRYFPPALRSIQPSIGFRTFTKEKEPGALRVFVLGESTVAGFPFHVNGSFAGFLEDELHATYPDRTIEVIDCGMSAISSYVVLDFAKQLVQYDPDLFLIYLGHNEFYGALGAASASPAAATRDVTLLRMRLAKSRTYQLVDNSVYRIRRAFAGKEKPSGRSLMAAMIGKELIRLEDPAHKMAERSFRANLDDMIEVAEAHGVRVVLSTVTCNLRDLEPFDSEHRSGANDEERRRVEAACHDGSIAALRTAVALDSTYAAAHYLLARALEADSTSRGEARREYVRARDHDVIHFRACTPFDAIIREAAAAQHVPLVDMDAAFAVASAGRAPGLNLFLEHLHPNLHGAILMASVFRDAMERERILPPAQSPDRSFDQILGDAGITALDIELARERIHTMTAQWPFHHAYSGPAEAPPASPRVAQLARKVFLKETDLAAAHEALGRAYLSENDLEHALGEFRALVKIYPISPSGQINTADVLLRLRRPAEAIPYYRSGLALDENAVNARWHLALAYRAVGDGRAAREECSRILAVTPHHAAALKLLKELTASHS